MWVLKEDGDMSPLLNIDQAVARLRQGQVVAIPTETVYGLAAAITSEEALRTVFQVKKRPFFDPLIVHIASVDQAPALTVNWDELSQALAAKFWPGPLTLVVPKSSRVPDIITAGLQSVAIRCPAHPVAREIISKLGTPLAAPSANLFGKTSPTTAQHVLDEFEGRVPVVDGGPCEVGLESTVVQCDWTGEQGKIRILRPGGVRAAQLQDFIREWNRPVHLSRAESKASPGHTEHHYQPEKPLVWLELKNMEPAANREQVLKTAARRLGFEISADQAAELVLPTEVTLASRTLYSQLRQLASSPAQLIYFIPRPEQASEEWEAVMDRLRRAASLRL